MTPKLFRGVFTAMVTPFTDSNKIDFNAFGALIDDQIAGGVDGILIAGTTGEAPSLSDSEVADLTKFAIERVGGRAKILVGAGTNDTAKTISALQKLNEISGIDGILISTPYYNKPTQKGLFLHFSAVAEVSKFPVILYNIKGRCAVNIATETILSLIEKYPEKIVAVKEASGDLDQVRDICQKSPENFSVMSGNDDQTVQIIELGGDGTISVLSNILPAETKRFVTAALDGDLKTGFENQNMYVDLIAKLFIETNPIPVKTALVLMGKCRENFRLPMCSMMPENRAILEKKLCKK